MKNLTIHLVNGWLTVNLLTILVACSALSESTPMPTTESLVYEPGSTSTPVLSFTPSPTFDFVLVPTFSPTVLPTREVELVATPTPTAMAATPVPDIASGAVMLFAYEDDLWRADVDGQHVQRLTEGGLLNWGWNREDDTWWRMAIMRPVRVSPDGRWIAFSENGRNLVLVDMTQPIPARFVTPGNGDMAWSNNSRYLAFGPHSLQVYDVQEDQSTSLATGYGRGILNIVWSPDDRFIAFACCFVPANSETNTGIETGEIQQIEVSTAQVQTVGQTTLSVGGGSPPLCWTDTGAVIIATTDQVRNCSYQNHLARLSPDGSQSVFLASASPEDSELSLLIVKQVETGQILWQRDIAHLHPHRVAWSLDGQYLLIDGGAYDTPIWRVKADGSSEREETIIEAGLLLGIIPQWQVKVR